MAHYARTNDGIEIAERTEPGMPKSLDTRPERRSQKASSRRDVGEHPVDLGLKP